MKSTILKTDFQFPGQKKVYNGKVRDVYTVDDGLLISVATDRISAFDYVLPKGIPFKGQVLNQVAQLFLENTKDIVPNWLIASPDPNVSIGYACEPILLEMVVRGYLAGHAARVYKQGKRLLCGVVLPEGMKEGDAFPEPIITPSTKSDHGHDEEIAKEDIIKRGIVTKEVYDLLEQYSLALFQRGTEIAAKQGLILVDTKYEFGFYKGEIMLIDEIHTPDSSRYFYAEGYEQRQKNNEPQKQLSKEFVRQWLIENDFQGLEGQQIPEMTDEFVQSITERYIELYERITGKQFQPSDTENIADRIARNTIHFLNNYKK
jgi:phosphoribosylaminoimidazole-succinocarboxamide synthase